MGMAVTTRLWLIEEYAMRAILGPFVVWQMELAIIMPHRIVYRKGRLCVLSGVENECEKVLYHSRLVLRVLCSTIDSS